MNQGKTFLSIKELQSLMGTAWYGSAKRRHKAIRDRIRPGKPDLTIREYCEFAGLRYRETYRTLRGADPDD
jgi:G:T-mismatch repair DNA endonuclease (very short patch repair protein)